MAEQISNPDVQNAEKPAENSALNVAEYPSDFYSYAKKRQSEDAKEETGDDYSITLENDPPAEKADDKTPAKKTVVAAEGEASNPKEIKSDDSSRDEEGSEGEQPDDSTGGTPDKKGIKSGKNPKWVDRKINSAVLKATRESDALIKQLQESVKAQEKSSSESNSETVDPPIEPEIDDFETVEEYTTAINEYQNQMDDWEVEHGGYVSDEVSNNDPKKSDKEVNKEGNPQYENISSICEDIDMIIDNLLTEAQRKSFWGGIVDQDIYFPDPVVEAVNEINDDSEIANVIAHFVASPRISRRIARIRNVNTLKAELANIQSEPPDKQINKESKGSKSISKKPVVEPVNQRGNEIINLHDPEITFEDYARQRLKQDNEVDSNGL